MSSSSDEKSEENDNDDLSIYSLVIDDETQKNIEAIACGKSDRCSTEIESLINEPVVVSDVDNLERHVSFETHDRIQTVIETPINLAYTAGFLRDMPNDIINEQCQFARSMGNCIHLSQKIQPLQTQGVPT